MFDTRNLTDIPSFDGELIPDQFWSLSAVLNYAYAKQHGYGFRFVHVDESSMLKGFSVAWHRVFYFAEQLGAMKPHTSPEEPCSWLLYLDTDAFVRDFAMPLPDFLSGLASRYSIRGDVGAIFAQEQSLPNIFRSPWHAVNAGVYFIHANQKSRHLFDVWQSAARDDDELKTHWPGEQGVLTELVFPGRYYTRLDSPGHPGRAHLKPHEGISSTIALVNMTEMNSPWGRFVEHLWSGPGWEKRDTDFMEMLRRIKLADPSSFGQMLHEVRQHVVRWSPKLEQGP